MLANVIVEEVRFLVSKNYFMDENLKKIIENNTSKIGRAQTEREQFNRILLEQAFLREEHPKTINAKEELERILIITTNEPCRIKMSWTSYVSSRICDRRKC